MRFTFPIVILAICTCLAFGQSADTLAAYPCTQKIPTTPSFIYCENGKEIKCQVFVARKTKNRIRIVASKPENASSLLPRLTIVLKSDTLLGMHKSENDKINNFSQRETMGDNIMYSQIQSGFLHVYIEASDEEYISGKFATVLFNTSGSSGQLLSGAFKVPFKKE